MKRWIQVISLLFLLGSVCWPLPIKALEDTLSVAIVLPVSHPSLDQIVLGIVEGLEEEGYVEGNNLTLMTQNAQSDMSMLSTIADSVISTQPDLIFAVATPSAQALQQRTQEIPIIMAGISDPIGAGLIDSFEIPGGNITGVSDAAPLKEHFDLIQNILPHIERIGMIYTNSEDNSKAEVDKAKAIAESRGIQVEVATITTPLDMQLVAQELAPKVEAIFVPTDNNIASAFETLVTQMDRYHIPIFPTVDVMVQSGGLASIGINQKGIGKQAAKVGLKVLENQSPQRTPVEYASQTRGVYNSQTADYLNISLPEDLIRQFEDMTKEN